jgi:benzoyl-CoA reductase/2-hydroxyglutaryl-CoA dehydratase subunit BcrC/BadD/HgdB
MGLLPIVLWNNRENARNLELSDKHIQNYSCGIARELVQSVLSDTGALLDGFFSYNACDTLRNLPEIIQGHFKKTDRPIPMFRMHVPQVNRLHTDPLNYLKQEISQVIDDVEWAFNKKFSHDKFRQTAEKYARMRSLCMDAESLVAKGSLSFSIFCSTVLSCYSLPVDEQIAALTKTISNAKEVSVSGTTDILISGIMPPPPAVISAMENAGLRVVANDIASLRRSYGYSPAVTDNPADYYTDYFTHKFPCTTLLYQSDDRLTAFMNLVESSGAKGVVFSGEKFCEYEYFEFPFIEQALKERGISVLRLEFGVDDVQNTGPYTTRVEAFSELFV